MSSPKSSSTSLLKKCEKVKRHFYCGFPEVDSFIEVTLAQPESQKKRRSAFSTFSYSSNKYSDINNLNTFAITTKEFLIIRHKDYAYESNNGGNVSLSYKDIPLLQKAVNELYDLSTNKDQKFFKKINNEWELTEEGTKFKIETKPFHDGRSILFKPIVFDLNPEAADIDLSDLQAFMPGIIMYIDSYDHYSLATLDEFGGFRYNLNNLDLFRASQELMQMLLLYEKL
jgi:hypothetical protein